MEDKVKRLKAGYCDRGLNFCYFCGDKFNLGAKSPRIIVVCGHTFCSECLESLLRNGKVKCPLCRKKLKLDRSDQLPLNYSILFELIILSPILKHIATEEKVFEHTCISHPSQNHQFYCDFHSCLFCSDCL